MLETALHAGSEHPSLLWVIVPSLLTFAAGLGIGTFSDKLRALLRSETKTDPTAE